MTGPDEGWEALKKALPVGRRMQGQVTAHARFGFFVELDEHPDANAPDFERAAGQLRAPLRWTTESSVPR